MKTRGLWLFVFLTVASSYVAVFNPMHVLKQQIFSLESRQACLSRLILKSIKERCHNGANEQLNTIRYFLLDEEKISETCINVDGDVLTVISPKPLIMLEYLYDAFLEHSTEMTSVEIIAGDITTKIRVKASEWK